MNRSARSIVALLLAAGLAAHEGCGDDGSGTSVSADTDVDTDSETDGDTDSCSELVWEGEHTILGAEQIEELAGYTEITGNLYVQIQEGDGNPTDLSGLECLELARGGVFFESAAGLESLAGLDNLREIRGSLLLGDCDGLADLHGLDALERVGWSITIDDNDSLASLAGLDSLVTARSITIRRNPSLTDMEGLGSLDPAFTELNINWNDSLTSLDGLGGGGTAIWSLDLDENPLLTSLSGLEWLTEIRCTFSLWGGGEPADSELASLAGLDNLEAVGRSIGLGDFPLLTSLDALDDLSSLGMNTAMCFAGNPGPGTDTDTWTDVPPYWDYSHFSIADNPSLPTCEVVELAERLVDAGFEGSVNIDGNLLDECSGPCPDYTGDDPCCVHGDPCGWAENDVCDCDSTCDWDAVDCEW